jgi:hypothetical protein
MSQNLLGPPPTRLPDEPERTVVAALAAGTSAKHLAAEHPTASAAWAALADEAWHRQEVIESYAYARVGYHRGLDALRRSGWRGTGPVPWDHEPNRGFLRAVHALGRAAAGIGEDDEAARCRTLLDDCDPVARTRLA